MTGGTIVIGGVGTRTMSGGCAAITTAGTIPDTTTAITTAGTGGVTGITARIGTVIAVGTTDGAVTADGMTVGAVIAADVTTAGAADAIADMTAIADAIAAITKSGEQTARPAFASRPFLFAVEVSAQADDLVVGGEADAFDRCVGFALGHDAGVDALRGAGGGEKACDRK